ncbi:MAG: replication initiation factor domain-containing protein [Lactobacillus sp.]|jgi:hypothetical protein|nr:replication initiation factor domain-containing protein [Lactobacillus sp.]
MNRNDQNKKVEFLSNSRSGVQILNLCQKEQRNYCEIKLDEIVISGVFFPRLYQHKLTNNHWQLVKPGQYQLFRNEHEANRTTVATLVRNDHQPNSWRIDTSNHLQGKEKQAIQSIINLFEQPHLTRIDIAFDFINFDNAGMHNRFTSNSSSTRVNYSRGGMLESIYCGGKGSPKVYRYYDKARERHAKHCSIPPSVNSWERLEMQLRGKETANWLDDAKQMLAIFKRPVITDLSGGSSINEYIYALALIDHPDIKQHLAKGTKAKYNKLLKSLDGFDDTYSKAALEELKKQTTQIDQEINSFLPQPFNSS